MDALGAHFRVVRYDPRGHGHSEVSEHPLTIERLGRDVLDVMDAYRIDRASFCGLSMGGMVGQWLGAHAPERIERLVLANTAPSMGPRSRWQERIDRVLREGMGAIADDVVERWFTPSFRERAPAAVAQMRTKLLAMDPAGYAGCCAAIRDLDLRESAGRIIVTMTHTAPSGASKIVPECTLPLTARGVVDLVITELAVFRFEAGRLYLIELMPGVTLDEVRAKTTAGFVSTVG